jgi:hypothetical protein
VIIDAETQQKETLEASYIFNIFNNFLCSSGPSVVSVLSHCEAGFNQCLIYMLAYSKHCC